jgi:tRNA threonylcarbamoyl adenosine modification protein YjeE
LVKPFATYDLPNEAATARCAQALATLLRSGDVLLLQGDLGSGKTSFARALLRHLAGEAIEVPSPTFTLVQVYEIKFPAPRGGGEGLTIWHFDLYRLSRPEEIYELGWEEATGEGIALVEWPERLGHLVPPDALTIRFGFAGNGRSLALCGNEVWQRRIVSVMESRPDDLMRPGAGPASSPH